MHIGIDARCLTHAHRTGVGEFTYQLLNALFSLDTPHTYSLFYSGAKNMGTHVKKWDLPHVSYVYKKIPNKWLHASIVFFKHPQLDRLCDTAPDVFFSPNLHFTAVSKGVKHVQMIHDMSFEIDNNWFSTKRKLWHRLVRPRQTCERANMIITPSENTKRDLVNMYRVDEQKVHVVHGGVSLSTKHNDVDRYKLPSSYMLFLGTIEPRKNVFTIIEAYTKTALREKGIELIIAGAPGWKNKDIMKKIEATAGVRYIGYVDDQDKAVLYKQARVFIYPSLYEGFGFPILEAMHMGTPVITSNRSSMPEIVDDAACLVDPNNAAHIATAMQMLCEKESLRTWYIDKGYKQQKKYRWEISARQFLQHIESL